MVKQKISHAHTNIVSYLKNSFTSDIKAGFITAVVALPLALAFALASGVPPIMGMYTAFIAGILGSLFGGSNFSITGPTGAMAVIILSTVNKFGIEGLLLAGFVAGLFQILFGLLKIGKIIKFIPLPLVSGFTSGIGIIIFTGQIANALGLILPPEEHIWDIFIDIFKNFDSINLVAVGITLSTILVMVYLPKIKDKFRYISEIPPSMIALVVLTLLVYLFHWDIPQVGDIPAGLPAFKIPLFTFHALSTILSAGLTIALLGSIEALLCAVVCDAMTNTRHKSNKELISQGVVNTILPFFGGMPATAAIARSAVNVREGAKTRYSGVFHGVFLMLVLIFLGPIATHIPKSFLAGVLMVVSFRMINYKVFKTAIKISKEDTIVLSVTFILTIFTDLVLAVQVGMVLAIFLLFIRITQDFGISRMEDYSKDSGINTMIYQNPEIEKRVNVYTIHGPFFFGAMNVFDHKINDYLTIRKPYIIMRMRYVPFIDSTGLIRLKTFIKDQQKHGSQVLFFEMSNRVNDTLFKDDEFVEYTKENTVMVFNKLKDVLKHVESTIKKETGKE